ncbi:MAG TPA: hypothetical protein VF815_32285 [Myxococcaceae bacterium]|jgi:hypothetical protein
MQPILDFIEQKTRELEQTPILKFLRDSSIDPRQRFAFAPVMAPWAFGFADINKFVLRDESSTEPIQKIINTHTMEDDHHWGMYLKDLRTLGMNDATDYVSILRMLWGEESKKTRQTVYGLIGLISAAKPKMRLVIVEAIEAAGNTGLKGFVQAAEEYHQVTGDRLVYFGDMHMDLESGHAMGTDDVEDKLTEFTLTAEEEKEARVVVEKIFKLVSDMGDEYLAYANKHPRHMVPKAVEAQAVAQAK